MWISEVGFRPCPKCKSEDISPLGDALQCNQCGDVEFIPIGDARRYGAIPDSEADTATISECEHEWISARNKVVESGEICLKCNSIRAEPEE